MKKLSLVLAIFLMISVLAGCSPAVQDETKASSQSVATEAPTETEAESESIDIFADVEPAEVPEVPDELSFPSFEYCLPENYSYEILTQKKTLKDLYDSERVVYVILCDVVSDRDEYADMETNDIVYADVEVVRVFKGDCQVGDMFTVFEFGTRVKDSNKEYSSHMTPLLNKNMRVLLFLTVDVFENNPNSENPFTPKEGYRLVGLGAEPYLSKVYIDENNMAYPAAVYAAFDTIRPYWYDLCPIDFRHSVPLGKLIAVLESYAEQ